MLAKYKAPSRGGRGMGRKYQLNLVSFVSSQLSGCYYLTERIKPLLGQLLTSQFFEGMYIGYTMSRLKNYHIMRTFGE